MTAEEFRKYAVDLFGGEKIKVPDIAHGIFKLKYGAKMFVEKKRQHDLYQKQLRERFKPINLTESIRRLGGV